MKVYGLSRYTIFVMVACLEMLLPNSAAAAKSKSVADVTRDGKPNIRSAASLVVDLSSNTVIYEKDADLVRPIASISKLFGALVLLEECKLDPEGLHEMTKANREAARGGDKSKLTTGWSYSHRDLLHAALMRSDNRALPALAEACGMTPSAFAERMTLKARSLGLVKTRFTEPDGLSAGNVSTAREVMVALKEAIKLSTLTEVMEKPTYTLVAHKGDKMRTAEIRNTDRLLSKNLAVILGGKTGYTDLARYCLAVAARTFKGRDIGMVFLGAEGRYTRFADFSRVIKWLGADEALAAAEAPKPSEKPLPAAQAAPTPTPVVDKNLPALLDAVTGTGGGAAQAAEGVDMGGANQAKPQVPANADVKERSKDSEGFGW